MLPSVGHLRRSTDLKLEKQIKVLKATASLLVRRPTTISCLSTVYDLGPSLQSEGIQKMKIFFDKNHDLQKKLKPQWERLVAVHAQHGRHLNTLTDRVGEHQPSPAAPERV